MERNYNRATWAKKQKKSVKWLNKLTKQFKTVLNFTPRHKVTHRNGCKCTNHGIISGHLQKNTAAEQSKQYLQLRWRAQRRRRKCGKSMVLIQMFSSASRPWMHHSWATSQIFIRPHASAPSVSQEQGLSGVEWRGMCVIWRLIKFPCWIPGDLTSKRSLQRDRLQPLCFCCERIQRLDCVNRAWSHPNEVLK